MGVGRGRHLKRVTYYLLLASDYWLVTAGC